MVLCLEVIYLCDKRVWLANCIELTNNSNLVLHGGIRTLVNHVEFQVIPDGLTMLIINNLESYDGFVL